MIFMLPKHVALFPVTVISGGMLVAGGQGWLTT